MSALEHLEPKSVFHFFEELCRFQEQHLTQKESVIIV